MENNKKVMFISAIIGIGIGLLMSGIILIFLIYNVNNKNIPSTTNSENISKDDSKVEAKIENSGPKNTVITPNGEKAKTKEIKEKANIGPTKEEKINMDLETIEIEISETATASQIADLLEKGGVIPNAREFRSYIISKGADRTLIHGRKTFEKNSDYETVLKVLMTYE